MGIQIGDFTWDYTTNKGKRKVILTYETMYTHNLPEINFTMLEEISEYFGTKDIGWDNYTNARGCDTCGYGGSHETSVEVSNITKHLEILDN